MDLYVVLGVSHGATESDIKRAYRRLARRFHPDINPGDRAAEARFRQIVEAYETLTDPDRRSRYDSGNVSDAHQLRRSSGFEGFDFSAAAVEPSVTFGDLFAEVLVDRTARRPALERGADLHHVVELSFEEALAGTTRSVTVTRRESCRTCSGTGRARASTGPCPLCDGTGTVRSVRGHMVFSRSCTGCGGSGQQRPQPCDGCGGLGLETRSETVQVRLPAGIGDGARVRVPAKGNAGSSGGPPGDLYITTHVASHPVFRRQGDDVHVRLPVAVHEAALGARVDVPAPDGPVRLRVPPGTQSGQRFRLRDRGAVSTRDGRRGDLVVEVYLTLPKILDERSKELLREFGAINGGNVREPLAESGQGSAETDPKR